MKKNLIFLILASALCTQVFAEHDLSAWQKVQTENLNYLVHAPKTNSTDPANLIISLHGCAQHAEDLAFLGNWESAADSSNTVVVLPNVPNGGVVLGCWDYYGRDHSEKNRHNGPLISMVENLIADKKLKINKSKVFISGLSSGAGQAAILGCLRPDLFSGVGLNAGPAVSTEQNEVYNPRASVDDVSDFCMKLAGARASHFSKQVLSVIVSDKDLVVHTKHSELTVQAMRKVYQTSGSKNLDLSTLKGVDNRGRGIVFTDSNGQTRVSYIINNGLGHAWASGNGPGVVEHYINPNSINYPQYLVNLFINR